MPQQRKNLNCESCEKLYSSRSSLHRHRKKCITNLPFQCGGIWSFNLNKKIDTKHITDDTLQLVLDYPFDKFFELLLIGLFFNPLEARNHIWYCSEKKLITTNSLNNVNSLNSLNNVNNVNNVNSVTTKWLLTLIKNALRQRFTLLLDTCNDNQIENINKLVMTEEPSKEIEDITHKVGHQHKGIVIGTWKFIGGDGPSP